MARHVYIKLLALFMTLLPMQLLAQDAVGTKLMQEKQLVGIERLSAKAAKDPKTKELGIPQPLQVKKKSPFHQMPSRMKGLAPMERKEVARAASRPLTLWGSMVYADSWDDIADEGGTYPYGFYSFKATESITPAILSDVDNYLYINGGGTVYDNKFHGVQYETSVWFGTTVYYVEYDTKTWKQTALDVLDDMSLVATAVAHDPVTGRNYGICYDFNEQGQAVQRKLSIIDYEKRQRSDIATLSKSYVAMACGNDGSLFGIGADGNLYGINKANGTETLVGATGQTPSSNLQSAAFDPKSGKMYWAAMLSGNYGYSYSELLEVNTENGAATKVGTFSDGEEFTALYIPAPEAEDGAPARISDLNLIFATEAVSGRVVFTLPKKTFAGDKLTGDLEYAILVNGVEAASGTGAAGTPVNKELTVEPGMTTVTVYTTNSVGKSPEAQVTTYLGPDTPLPPTKVDFSYSEEEEKASLSWDAPTKGVHSGLLKAENVAYDVVRYPDATTVASKIKDTQFTDNLPKDQQLTAYTYGVFAYNGDIKGSGRRSNKIVVGRPMEAPYAQDFSSQQAFDIFEIQDANRDGNTWKKYMNTAQYSYSFYNKADDWLITPPVKLSAGHEYTFSVKAKRGMEKYMEKIMLGYGEGTDAAKFTMLSDSIYVTATTDSVISRSVTIDKDGVYRFGIHAVSDANAYTISVAEVAIDQVIADNAPEGVTGLTVTPAPKGELMATVAFKCPDKRMDGSSLEAINKVVVKRNGNVVATVENPAPGSQQSVNDTGCVNGVNHYTVAVFDGDGYGKVAETDAFVGEDTPEKPKDFCIADLGHDVKASWTAPQKGANGQYVNPENITYNLYTVNDGYLYYYKRGLTDTSATLDDTNTDEGDPSLLYYYLGAISAGGESDPVPSNLMVKGAPMALPFAESFPNGELESAYLWTQHTGENGVTVATELAADNDNGCAYFMPKIAGDDVWLNLPKLDISGAEHPVFMFDYFALPGYKMKINAAVDFAPQGVDQVMQSVDFKTMTGARGWRHMAIDLTQFKGKGYVVPKIWMQSGSLDMPLVIDAIKVIDQHDYDLTAKIIAPESVTAGVATDVDLFISNLGANDATGIKASLYANGELVNSYDGATLQSGKYAIARFSWKPNAASDAVELKGEIVFDKDENPNDNTATTTVKVNPFEGKTVNDLSAAEVKGEGVRLEWTAPEEEAGGTAVTESFENYEPFTYKSIAPWTLVDGDGARTYGFGGGATFPNNGEPFAYIVFNPTATDWDQEAQQASFLAPHSGNQYLASFSAYQKANDDWLISPELPGTAQTISFWVKSESSQYTPENFEVLYSTTDKDTKSFTRIGDVRDAIYDNWSEVTVDLPEGAKYFAIRCVSNDKFMFMLDDITYIGAVSYDATPLAYNVYRDGKFVAKVDAAKTSYTDAERIPDAEHTYFITVVYAKGESAASNKVSLSTTAICSAEAAQELADAFIEAYSADGKLIAKGRRMFGKLPAGKEYVIKNMDNGTVVRLVK